jgi:lipopolysaccharide transport system ATP-binding protein
MSEIAIRVEGIGKKYRIGQKKSGELRETFSNILRSFRPAAISQQPAALKEFWALKDISFEVKQGEAVGIIGRNGAGKSTLLKVLSRITKPTTGRFEINGRVSSLLEVGTGFHPELTGRENIYLNGTILGMRRAEIKAKFDEIIDFSGVEEFIDTPVKHYSSGMKVRLAFSVAAHLEPEILIIDEVLAVGDAEFQKKCLGKMEDVTGEGRTVLFVSHNMGAVNQICSKGILISDGSIIGIDKTESVISKYMSFQVSKSIGSLSWNRKGNGSAKFEDFYLENENNQVISEVVAGYCLRLCFVISTYRPSNQLNIGFSLHGISGQNLSILYSNYDQELTQAIGKGKYIIKCQVENFPFHEHKIIVRGRIENNGLEADYPLEPLGAIKVVSNAFFKNSIINFPVGYPYLINAKWSVNL